MVTAGVRIPAWALAAAALAVIAAALAVLAVLGGRSLPERVGPPVEELAVERVVLSPGSIALTVRNVGPDPVQVAQVFVNDAYVDFTGGAEPVQRLDAESLTLAYPWQGGQPYLVSMLTSTGLVVEHSIPAAVVTPRADGGFLGLMVLLGTYVGIIPVVLGMLFLPVLRRAGATVVRVLLAVTVGLLAFLVVDGTAAGFELARGSGGAFGGVELVVLGAGLAFLALTGVDQLLRRRGGRAGGLRLALMIAVGIGLHNLGEGLAIGSAYAIGELALGAALVVGFAIQNTTEGLAVVAPLTRRRPSVLWLVLLGLVAGAPAILGALIGASVTSAELSGLLLGVGVGAILQVMVQLVPALRSDGGQPLEPAAIGGLAAGVAIMYVTGLLVVA